MILLFMDCETTGLDPVVHVPWEVAAVRAEHTEDGRLVVLGSYEARISLTPYQHATSDPVALDIGRFKERHRVRAKGQDRPRNIGRVAYEIDQLCDDKPHLAGANPNFDERRVGDLLRRCGITPRWHYRSIDVTTLGLGYLVIPRRIGQSEQPGMPSMRSEDISRDLGVDPDDFDRHTAMGDVRWCMAQYAAVFGLQVAD